MSHHAKAFWTVAPGRGEIRHEPLAALHEGQVRVRTLYTGISRGTEALVFSGRVPETEYERMRAPFQAGRFPAPVKYGYSSVGLVEEGALQGKTIFALYPHQDAYVIPADSVHLVPESVPPGRAVLAANMETALNGIWDARPHVGDRIAVIGAGTIGCLVAWLARQIGGCEVELIDINPRRADVARELGVHFAAPPAASRDADVVIHASGSAEGLALALGLAGFEATVVELSWYGATRVSVPLGEAFHARRLTIKSSQVGSIATTQRGRWDTRRRMQLALRMLANPQLDALISGESDFESLPEVMPLLVSEPGDTLCHRVKY
jgi:threonine dehydrogenase-like Zn-dependent dehydrogenase